MDLQKKKRNYYSTIANNHKKRRQLTLESGMTGFLCTCNFRQKDCVRDAYKILTEFSDENVKPNRMKDPEPEDQVEASREAVDDDNEHNSSENDDDDITTALSREINELKAEYSKPIADRKFQVVDTGAKNVIFIRSTLPNPLELVTKILVELDTTKKQRTRFLLRLLPVEAVCRANMTDINAKAGPLLEKYFAQEPKTFSIVFSRRSNNNIVREEIIEDIAEIITRMNPGNKADLKNPEIAVVIEVIRGHCLISIAPNYYKYKKYNLLEICNIRENRDDEMKRNNEPLQDCVVETDMKQEIQEFATDLSTKEQKSKQEEGETGIQEFATDLSTKEQIKQEDGET